MVARVVGVAHRYGSAQALMDVTLDLPAGQMLGLIGPDGAGKSTLLGLLAGARRLQTGRVEVLGGSMADKAHRDAVCPRIAYMPQGLGRNLYTDLSVRENMQFFGKLYGQAAADRRARIARLAGATGMEPFLDRAAGKLSGGMKQKLGLCCALIHDPDFLILDEPTTGVDPLSRRQFWDLIAAIRAERAGMTVLVSTAYMEEAARFDGLVVMAAGRVLATGSPRALLDRTKAVDLEVAFVALSPGAAPQAPLVIPPRVVTPGEPAIVARHLTRRFGDFTAVEDVSFEIGRGEIFGFLGSNGCGKTTVMKMLTGLLPATSGEATIFGTRTDAGNIETRRRVGVMSQSFSLYGELTVMQNLTLHARLFHLDRKASALRIAGLLKDFGLEAEAEANAGALPLGLRQRLSLAVAILHRPEMLILDEPTSGVDPLARDVFWRLLVDLARKEQVTIFLSTHFMNEAMRCDRISLMHAGRVLACDTPQTLAGAGGGAALEDVFVKAIQNAADPADPADQAVAVPKAQAVAGPEAAPAVPLPGQAALDLGPCGAANGASAVAQAAIAAPAVARAPGLGRVLAFAAREAVELLRDRIRLVFAFLGSAALLVVFAYGISTDVNSLSYAAFDQDQSPESRAFLANFSGSRSFVERPEVASLAQLEQRMRAGEIELALEIPAGFGRAVTSGAPAEVSARIDGAFPYRAATLEGYAQGAFASFVADRLPDVPASGLRIEVRYRYNPTFLSLYSMAPSIPAVLLMLFPAILMAVSVAGEREGGTITNFYVTPTRRIEFLIGKQLPYIAIGFANFLVLTAMSVVLFGVPLKGSFPALALGALAYVAASTGFGLVVSTFAKSQVAAVFATSIIAMVPTVQFSGLAQPVSTLEGPAHVIGLFWPTTWYMHMSVGAFAKGLGLRSLAPDILATAAFIPVFLLLATLFLRKQEA